MRSIREIDAFYEAQGFYSVPKDEAAHIYESAINLVSAHTGPIALKSVRGVRIPHEQPVLDIDKVRLGQSDHTALLTRRLVQAEAANSGIKPGITFYEAHPVRSLALKSKILVTTHNSTEQINALKTAHEIAQSFLLQGLTGKFCPDRTCLMFPNVSDELLEAAASRDVPFCEPCVEGLAFAGLEAQF